MSVWSLLDTLQFLHNDFQWSGIIIFQMLHFPHCHSSCSKHIIYIYILCIYFVYLPVVAIDIWFDLKARQNSGYILCGYVIHISKQLQSSQCNYHAILLSWRALGSCGGNWRWSANTSHNMTMLLPDWLFWVSLNFRSQWILGITEDTWHHLTAKYNAEWSSEEICAN